MEQATDEPSTSHALIADAYKYPDDFSSATYRLDPRAKWHDGQPITAEDVVWTFDVLKDNSPLYNRYYANVTEAVAVSDREVEFRFDQKGNRELPQDPRRPAGAAQALVGRHRRHRQEARHHAADAGAAARLGRLQDRELQGRPGNRLGARARTIGARSCR